MSSPSPSPSSTTTNTSDAAEALALLHERANAYRIKMSEDGNENETRYIYKGLGLVPPYHFFPTIVPPSRTLNPLPHGYTTYAGIYDRSATSSRSLRTKATDPRLAAHVISGKSKKGKNKGKGKGKDSLSKYEKKPKDDTPDNLCATRALIQAITHFGGPNFIRKLGAALKPHLSPEPGQQPTACR